MATIHKLNDTMEVRLAAVPGGMVEMQVNRGVLSFKVYVPYEVAYELAAGLDLVGVEAARGVQGVAV